MKLVIEVTDAQVREHLGVSQDRARLILNGMIDWAADRDWPEILEEPLTAARWIKEEVVCPYCGSRARLVDSKVVYGRSYGNIYLCKKYPACDSYVGVHQETNEPLGSLANKKLRNLRNQVHAIFDPLWQSDGMDRHEAYKWLALVMGLPEAHIGWFDERQCVRALKKIRHHRGIGR